MGAGYNLKSLLSITSNIEIAKLLIAAGAKANKRDLLGATPLHSAYSPEMIELLLANGADVNAQDKTLGTPLHWAADSGDLGRVKALVAHGADVNARGPRGNTPLHLAVRKNVEVVRYLLAHGAQIDARGEDGKSPLDCATSQSNPDREIVKCLREWQGTSQPAK